MKAKVGDTIVIQGNKVGNPERRGKIIDVRGPDGGPPYVVKWAGEEGEALMFPGSDAVIGR